MSQLQQIQSSVSIYSFESCQKTNHLLTDICFESAKGQNHDLPILKEKIQMRKGGFQGIKEGSGKKRDRWLETEKCRPVDFNDLKPSYRFLTVNDSSSNENFQSLIYNGEKKGRGKKQFMEKVMENDQEKKRIGKMEKQLKVRKKNMQKQGMKKRSGSSKKRFIAEKQKDRQMPNMKKEGKKQPKSKAKKSTDKNQKHKLETENELLWGLLRNQKYQKFLELDKRNRGANNKHSEIKQKQNKNLTSTKEFERSIYLESEDKTKCIFENRQLKLCNSSLKYLKSMQLTLKRVQKKLDKVMASQLTKNSFRQHKSLPR